MLVHTPPLTHFLAQYVLLHPMHPAMAAGLPQLAMLSYLIKPTMLAWPSLPTYLSWLTVADSGSSCYVASANLDTSAGSDFSTRPVTGTCSATAASQPLQLTSHFNHPCLLSPCSQWWCFIPPSQPCFLTHLYLRA